jgi:hypothetical protein
MLDATSHEPPCRPAVPTGAEQGDVLRRVLSAAQEALRESSVGGSIGAESLELAHVLSSAAAAISRLETERDAWHTQYIMASEEAATLATRAVLPVELTALCVRMESAGVLSFELVRSWASALRAALAAQGPTEGRTDGTA